MPLLVRGVDRGLGQSLQLISCIGSSGHGAWGYVFYIDFEGHHSDAKVQQVLKDLDQDSVEVRLLGSYPQAVL